MGCRASLVTRGVQCQRMFGASTVGPWFSQQSFPGKSLYAHFTDEEVEAQRNYYIYTEYFLYSFSKCFLSASWECARFSYQALSSPWALHLWS